MNFNLVETLRSGLDDLRRFPVMLVPLLAASIILFLMMTLLAGAGLITSDSGLELSATAYGVIFGAALLFGLTIEFIAFGILVCLAYDVVVSRVGDLTDGFVRFRGRFKTLLAIAIPFALAGAAIAVLVVMLTGIIGSLIYVAAVVPVMLLLLLALFSFVAAIYDDSGPMEAIAAAWSLLSSNLAAMLIFALAMFLIFMLLGMISSLLALTPVLGNIISSLLIAAYYALVVDTGMRVYRELAA